MPDEKQKMKGPTELIALIARKKEALDWRLNKDIADIRAAFEANPLWVCDTSCLRVLEVFRLEGYMVWKNAESDYRVAVPSELPLEVQNS